MMSIVAARFSSTRARSAGTDMTSLVRSSSVACSCAPICANAPRIACRSAGRSGSSGGAPAIAATSIGSYWSSMTTSSLVLKYRKNVLGEISAAAAICSTVVAS